tara:strand:+ start:1686 stop:2015 length:330 start_codon:yes stop_codon:yes gene_type:complete
MLNVTAVGNLTQDPEQKQINEDLTVTRLKILVNKKIKGEDLVSGIVCNIWGKKGIPAMAYLKKGDQITVQGEGIVKPYLRQNGEAGASIELNVQNYSLPQRPKKGEMPF